MNGIHDLNKIGKSWFVLYKYYEVIDKKELGWKNCKTVAFRINKYEKNRQYHVDVLKKILYTKKTKENNYDRTT